MQDMCRFAIQLYIYLLASIRIIIACATVHAPSKIKQYYTLNPW